MRMAAKFACFLIYLQIRSSYELESCLTPLGQSGGCIVINNCPPLIEIVKRTPLSDSDIQFLSASKCNPLTNPPKVCCPVADGSAQPSKLTNKVDLLPNRNDCGTSYEETLIIGGKPESIDAHPWTALIAYENPNKERQFLCGGTLINAKYVLTAAHCIENMPPSWKIVGVRLGEYNLETATDCINAGGGKKDCADPPRDISIETTIKHSGFSKGNPTNDIALLRLKEAVKYSNFIRPICMPKTQEELSKTYENQRLFVAGWGRTENNTLSNIKLSVQIPVVSNSECANIYKSQNIKIDDGQICAGGRKGRDSCVGDSGGPVMSISSHSGGRIHWVAAGIVSFGPSACGSPGIPGVYTRINYYMDWILSNLMP